MTKRLGDRRDGKLLRDVDPMHFITPIIYPNRSDNEAFISERIDLTNANAWLERKNASNPSGYPYNLFQIVVTAILKTVTLRPKLNRFIANSNLYQRNEVTTAFVVKKLFADDGAEALAFIHAADDDTIGSIHSAIFRQVSDCRSDKLDSSTKSMEMFNRMPRGLAKSLVKFVCTLDRHGHVPQPFIETDPYYSSAIITNLGSIQLHSGYHHLTNWGTTSIFCIIGEKKPRPFYDEAGNVTMRDSIDLGLTVDERIADGYYFSRSVKLLRELIEHPELLERPLIEPVE